MAERDNSCSQRKGMAIITGSAAQKAARGILQNVIREELVRGALSSTSEMMGYYLQGLSTAERYNTASAEPAGRRIAAPEFLTGLLKDDTA